MLLEIAVALRGIRLGGVAVVTLLFRLAHTVRGNKVGSNVGH